MQLGAVNVGAEWAKRRWPATSQKFRVKRKLLWPPTASKSSPKPDWAGRCSWQRRGAILTECFLSQLHPGNLRR